jgi:Na+/melibiose symporter-like transporter
MEFIYFLLVFSPLIICLITQRESWGWIAFLNIFGVLTIVAFIGFFFILLAFLMCFTTDTNKEKRLEEEAKEAQRKKEHQETLEALRKIQN